MYKIGNIYPIGHNNETYNFVNYHHQIGNPNKSWWTISMTNEAEFFLNMTKNNYISSFSNNGYYIDAFGRKPITIGDNSKKEDLYLAKLKFNKINWHGYPANHMIQKDRVEDEVLDKMNKDKIDPSILRKLKRAQKI